MPTRRRFVTDAPTDAADFARDVVIESWRSLLPQGSLVFRRPGLRGRLALIGCETIELDRASTDLVVEDRRSPSGPIAAGSLARLWQRSQRLPLRAHEYAVAVTTGGGSAIAPDDLAAAIVAVAGEIGSDTISVFQLSDSHSDETHRLVRAVRRLSDLPVSAVVHTGSTEMTAAALAACTLVVTHDDTTASITESLGTPTCRSSGLADLSPLLLAIRSAATAAASASASAGTVDAGDPLRDARALAYDLDLWARHRVSTRGLRESITRQARIDDLVGA